MTEALPLGTLSLWAAFALGLTGGFGHCLAMCGPFVSGASLGVGTTVGDRGKAARFQLAYHGGRLVTYGVIGLFLGLLGQAGAMSSLDGPFSPDALARYLKLGAGLGTIALGIWLLARWATDRTSGLPEPTAALVRGRRFSATFGRIMARSGRYGFVSGLMMGLLPCGPLLPAELAALASGSPAAGATLMVAFGLGTVPALAGFGAASGFLGAGARGRLTPLMGAAVIALGAVTTVQGLGLALARA